ncbi:hypothetical protein JCM5296_001304 [Sporobolomyces johnsonii]
MATPTSPISPTSPPSASSSRQSLVLPSSTRPPSVQILSLSSAEDLATRPRSQSSSSLQTTQDYYRVRSPSTASFDRRAPSPSTASLAAGRAVSPPATQLARAAGPSILPGSAFLNPKRPAALGSTDGRDSSPADGPPSLGAAVIPGTGGAAGGGGGGGVRKGNGPIITRVSSGMAFDGSLGGGRPTSPPVVSQPPAAPSAFYGASSSNHDFHGGSRRYSGEMSVEDVRADLAAGGKLARAMSPDRESIESSIEYGTGMHSRDATGTTLGLSPSHDGAGGGDRGVTPKASQEPLMRQARQSLSISPSPVPGMHLSDAIPPSPRSFPDHEKHPFQSLAPSPHHHVPPPPPNSRTIISIPLTPVTDPTGHALRNYQLHPGGNRFFLAGRLLSSRDNPWPFTVSLALAVAMPALFFAFSGPFLWQHLGGGGKASIFVFLYLCLVMWSSMLKTAWTDPGIVPRALDLTPQRKWVEDLNGTGQGGFRAEPRYLRVKEGVVASKWCETCETYRPPRTSHCRLCDNCVDHTDHHCAFLNNCIGRRNYTSFIAFLLSAIFCAIYAIVFSSWHIWRRHDLSSTTGGSWASKWDTVGSFVVAIVSFGLLVPVAGLASYHAKLLWTNRTTIEMLRPKADRGSGIDPATGQPVGNLWALSSPWRNMFALLCRPMEVESWIEPRAWAGRDAREEVGAGGKEGEV